jgi:maltooligosyltrehalose synthase
MAELPDPSEEVAARLLSAGLTGHLKLYVTRLLLHERRRRPELFERGSYHALSATTAHAFAFAREHDGERLLVVVPRLTHRSAKGAPPIGRGIWGNESLDLPEGWAGLFRDILSDGVVTAESGTLALQKVFSVLPVAVLRSAPDP